MAEVKELSEGEKSFIQPYLPIPTQSRQHHDLTAGEHARNDRPFVTLTYASSLDSMISLSPGVRTTLSGPETKSMTHYLRLHHEAILVGAGTAVADDPSLNCRYPGTTIATQPRPVIVDPTSRWQVDNSKVNALALENQGKAPWVLYAPIEQAQEGSANLGYERMLVSNDQSHEPPGAIPPQARKIEWGAILKALCHRGIESVIIEGGATVINELLSRPELVDTVIVTVAPTWLGHGGVTVSPAPKTVNGQRANAARLQGTAWRQFGEDAVVCGRLSG